MGRNPYQSLAVEPRLARRQFWLHFREDAPALAVACGWRFPWAGTLIELFSSQLQAFFQE
jgi:hypothetical protein